MHRVLSLYIHKEAVPTYIYLFRGPCWHGKLHNKENEHCSLHRKTRVIKLVRHFVGGLLHIFMLYSFNGSRHCGYSSSQHLPLERRHLVITSLHVIDLQLQWYLT